MATQTTDEKAAALKRLRDARRKMTRVQGTLEDARSTQGEAAVAAQAAGATLTEIGDALGLSKQRAFDLIAAAKDNRQG